MIHNLDEIWERALAEMSKNLSKPSFETWLKSTRAVSVKDQTIIVEVPNDFTKDWFESRYKNMIIKAINSLTDESYEISFVISSNILDDVELDSDTGLMNDFAPKKDFETKPSYYNDLSLFNPRYAFSTFVVGSCNRLSHAASLAVAETPSRAYNPLFIYGGVGLGKTHLLHAIAQYVINNHAYYRVLYFSSEKFTNEFINAIRDNKTLEFRNKYRNIDVLLIDDIQFLARKEQTQEEFFHTFNALYENNRQLIISSDRPPKEIPTLEDRLRSRFEWGLITDIQQPDLETRIAILKKKADSDGINISDEVIQYIAGKFETNIRELEGALIRLVAYASLSKSPITMALTDEALKHVIFNHKKNINAKDVIKITAGHFDLEPEQIQGKKRTQDIAMTRQVAMFLTRELTDLSLPKIGEEFGGRDHTTVMHACKKIQNSITEDVDFKAKIEMIRNDILHNR